MVLEKIPKVRAEASRGDRLFASFERLEGWEGIDMSLVSTHERVYKN